MKRSAIAIAVVCVVGIPAGARAADKEHQQIMAELRMLQEQQAQLVQMLGTLSDALKTVSTKMDEQMGVTQKTLADQKLLVQGVSETVRVLREKADDTNVRLSSVQQELQSIRHTIASIPAPAPAAVAPDPNVPVDPNAPPTPPQPSLNPPPSGISPQRMWDNAFADYAAGQYDLAVLGFETYIKTFPQSDLVDDAQMHIAHSLYNAGKYQDAVQAAQKVISDYPQSNSVPGAYYKMGQSYEQLKDVEAARKAYETVVKDYPNALQEASLAKQALDRINRKE
jgi:tol-pal system protein YbgF